MKKTEALLSRDRKTRLRPTTCENKKHLIDSKVLPALKNLPVNTFIPTPLCQGAWGLYHKQPGLRLPLHL